MSAYRKGAGTGAYLIDGFIGGLSGMMIFGLIVGLVSGLIGGFTYSVKVRKESPNQGIKLSLKNSSIAFLVIGPISVLMLWTIFAFGRSGSAVIGSVNFGLIVGLIVGLNRGGLAVIKHYALRLILWRNGHTPFKFIKFLDHCDKLILLNKVGGGYIFIHRMLLDYFADIPTQDTSAKR
jgi:F0F1-type ATP synthase assembly protein I